MADLQIGACVSPAYVGPVLLPACRRQGGGPLLVSSSGGQSKLDVAPRNTAAVDYFCPACESPFQLKSQWKPLGTKIVDAAYSEMKRTILEDRTPNLFVLHCDLDTWAVRTVLLVPHFAFALSTLVKRPPLSPTAGRAGWVGCNILLDKIPVHARISIVSEGNPRTPHEVRRSYDRLPPLEKLQVEKRGWTLDATSAC